MRCRRKKENKWDRSFVAANQFVALRSFFPSLGIQNLQPPAKISRVVLSVGSFGDGGGGFASVFSATTDESAGVCDQGSVGDKRFGVLLSWLGEVGCFIASVAVSWVF